MKKGCRWTEEEYVFLENHASDMTREELAAALDRSVDSVNHVCGARRIVTKGQKRRLWTEDQIRYLEENWGRASMETMVKRLGRTPIAIQRQAYDKLHLGSCVNGSDYITVAEFCRLSGISRNRIFGSIFTSLKFPILRKKILNRRIYYVDLEKAERWMEEHQDLYNGVPVSESLFADDPTWLRAKKQRDRQQVSCVEMKKWTAEELSRLKMLLRRGMPFPDLAKEFKVTENQVRRAVYNNGLSYQCRRYWSSEDFRFLKENWEKLSDVELAKATGHSRSSVKIQRDLLGFVRESDHTHLSAAEKRYILDHRNNMSQRAIAQKLGRHINSIARFLAKHKEDVNGSDI